MLEYSVIKNLKDILGKDSILTEVEDRTCYSYDATGQKFMPDAVIFPSTAGEISRVLKLANKAHFNVIPRGAGTGFTGGALTVSGGVAMVLTRMNRVINIDTDNFTAEVEPGVVTYDLHRAVEKLGLFYPPDPGSMKTCTIGGNVAECAGGPRALKYGVTKDYVIGLEAVLPNGDIINTGTKTIKGVVGYDLTKLIVGSEGTLAVVTKVRLKLLPKPRGKKTMLAFFSSVKDAAGAVPEILHKKVIPSALEMLDRSTIDCIRDTIAETNIKIPNATNAILIIEVDSNDLNDEVKAIKEVLKENKAINTIIAADEKEQDDIWNVRRRISPAITKIANKKINEDIVVPRTKIPDAIDMIGELSDTYNVKIATFGHAGDGNIHVNIMIDKDDKDEVQRAEDAVRQLFKNVIALGGTLSGEHGVGIVKAPYIDIELKKPELLIMKRIKETFDPNNILNPGKIFYYGD
jgi:glycolate oxidase